GGVMDGSMSHSCRQMEGPPVLPHGARVIGNHMENPTLAYMDLARMPWRASARWRDSDLDRLLARRLLCDFGLAPAIAGFLPPPGVVATFGPLVAHAMRGQRYE